MIPMTARQMKVLFQLRQVIIETMHATDDGSPILRHSIVVTALHAVARACTDQSISLSKEDFLKIAAEAYRDNTNE